MALAHVHRLAAISLQRDVVVVLRRSPHTRPGAGPGIVPAAEPRIAVAQGLHRGECPAGQVEVVRQRDVFLFVRRGVAERVELSKISPISVHEKKKNVPKFSPKSKISVD